MAITSYDYSGMSADGWLTMLRAHFTLRGYRPVQRVEQRVRGLTLYGIQHESGHAFVQGPTVCDDRNVSPGGPIYHKGLLTGVAGGWYECQWELLGIELMGALSHKVTNHEP